jgi:hypothetical protein
MTRKVGTLYEDQYIFLVVSRSILPIMRNVSDKSFGENQNTRFFLIFFENIIVFEITWEDAVEPEKPQIKI